MSVKKSPFDYPKETWKKYRVFHTSFGFDWGHFMDETAPNKTWARRFVQGQLNPGCKVTKIVEIQ